MLGSVIVYPRMGDDGPYLDLWCPGCEQSIATGIENEALMVLVGRSWHDCPAIDTKYLNELLQARYGGYEFRDWRTGLPYVKEKPDEPAPDPT